MVKWVCETWQLTLSESSSQFANSHSWHPDSYPEQTSFHNSFVCDALSSGSFCCFVASPSCSCVLAAGLSEQTLLYPILPYKPLSLFSELWKGKARRSGCSTCFCFQCFHCPIREALKNYIVLAWHKVQIDAFLWMLHFVTASWLLVKGVSFYSSPVWFKASCSMGGSIGHHLFTYRLRWDPVPMTL